MLAAAADAAGVDRIGPDFELLGKRERQSPEYRISCHSRERLPDLRRVVTRGALFARTDPVNPATPEEVETLLAAGVEILMVPMVKSAADVATFNACVAGRARIVLLVEHIEALRSLDEVLAVPGSDEIHIGLNDLALSIGESERFALLCSPMLDDAVARIHSAGLPLGIAGIGRPDDRSLPIPCDLIYAQVARLGASSTLLARSFVRDAAGSGLTVDVARARRRLAFWQTRPDPELVRARAELGEIVGAPG